MLMIASSLRINHKAKAQKSISEFVHVYRVRLCNQINTIESKGHFLQTVATLFSPSVSHYSSWLLSLEFVTSLVPLLADIR